MASDWWSRKLNSEPTSPARQPDPRMNPPARQSPSQRGGEYTPTGNELMDTLAQAALSTGGSKKLRENSGTCPECGSGNYFVPAAEGMNRMKPAARCYDCGYPIVQSGSGTGHSASEGPTRAARQLPGSRPVDM